MPSWEDIWSWLLQNLLWEILKPLGVAVVATVITRIGFWIFGPKKLPRKKEAAFWITGCLGGTLLLLLALPLRNQGRARFGTPDLHCQVISAMCYTTNYKQPFEAEPQKVTSILIWARVVNNGSPSSVAKWHLKASLGTGVPMETDVVETPVLVFSVPGKPSYTCDAGQYLVWQLMDRIVLISSPSVS